MTPDGVLTALVLFTGSGGDNPGSHPYTGLIRGTDGNLYGTTSTGGSRGAGNIFRLVMPGPLLTPAQSGHQLILSWRTNYAGFKLQSIQDPGSSNWADSTNSPVISGNQFFVTNPISAGAQFFRLKK